MSTQPTTPSSEMPLLPLRDKELPPIIREVVSNAPTHRKLPAFVACLSPLCALATRIRLRYYYDGSRQSALLLQVIIEAPQSAGKQFAADIERLIMETTLKERDLRQRREEQLYREKRRSRRANDRLEEEPKTTIRVIPPTISKTVLVRRADFYERNLGDVLSFWMFAEELAQVTDAGSQSYSNLRTIMRTAYDLGSRFGIDFASDTSYSAIADINICSMFCTTPAALDDYMNPKAIEGGNITRTILCQLGDELGADGAIFKPYSEEQKQCIEQTLQRMMHDTYADNDMLQPEQLLHMEWLDRDVRKWCVEKGREALLAGSTAMDVFRKRASVSSFRIAALCYYLYRIEHCPEEVARKHARKLYLFMADYILSSQLKRWGKAFEKLLAKRTGEGLSPTGQPRLIDRITDEFTRDQLNLLLKEQELATPVRVLLSKWKAKGWIEMTAPNHYRKITNHV